MATQEEINGNTMSYIGDAIQAVVDQWPDLRCSACTAVRPFIVTDLQINYEDPTWDIDKKPWRVRGLQRLPAPGWVEISIEGTQNGLKMKKVFCPTCAKGKVL